ncbi:MAG: DUF4190 domain-containing protein [Kineosporiaceae bacterium]|nr:DUF4190 domain-containing protein [Aeromicrobium sp.]
MAVVPAIVSWIAWLVARSEATSAARRSGVAAQRDQTAIEAQASAIRQWQAAYALANPGQPIPVAPSGIGAVSQGPNVFAILALVFGVGGGFLAIVFGHIALGQIKRTGQGGFAAAVVGLILGYAWVAVVVFVLVAGIVLRQ